MSRGKYSRKRVAILEQELQFNRALQAVALKVEPGETMLVSYWPNFDLSLKSRLDAPLTPEPEIAHVECTYKEVRLALARLVLKGIIK